MPESTKRTVENSIKFIFVLSFSGKWSEKVSISSTFYVRIFHTKVALLSFSLVTFWRKKALLYKKLVRKMLKKLTAGIPHSLRPYVWMRLTGALQKKAASELTYKQIVKASTNDHLVNYNIEYITLIQSNILEPYFHIIQQYLHFCVNTF